MPGLLTESASVPSRRPRARFHFVLTLPMQSVHQCPRHRWKNRVSRLRQPQSHLSACLLRLHVNEAPCAPCSIRTDDLLPWGYPLGLLLSVFPREGTVFARTGNLHSRVHSCTRTSGPRQVAPRVCSLTALSLRPHLRGWCLSKGKDSATSVPWPLGDAAQPKWVTWILCAPPLPRPVPETQFPGVPLSCDDALSSRGLSLGRKAAR